MKLHEILVSIPQGYVLCPFPKQWLREYEEIKIVMPQEFLREPQKNFFLAFKMITSIYYLTIIRLIMKSYP